MNDLNKLLFKKVPLKILLKIDEKNKTYATEINHEIEGNYSYIIKLISDFEDQGLVKTEKDGRKKIILLTKEGQRIINKIKQVLGEKKENKKTNENQIKKINKIKQKVNEIYNEEIEGKKELKKEDSSRIGKRLGPYKRELQKIDKDKLTNKTKKEYRALKSKIKEIMEKKNDIKKKR